MTENSAKQFSIKPYAKWIIIAIIIILVFLLIYLIWGNGLLGGSLGMQEVNFTQLEKENIPQSIEKDVIPEYRDLERALGCLIDGKVYVIVTRGEKPTAGYNLTIEDMGIEKTDLGTNLVVTALFTEPKPDEAVSQVITYPYVVAETQLQSLPNTIELQVRYAD